MKLIVEVVNEAIFGRAVHLVSYKATLITQANTMIARVRILLTLRAV